VSGSTALQPLCHYGCGRMVSIAGKTCWPCQSYEDYLMAPRCDCPHDPNCECRCYPECEEDCPSYDVNYDDWPTLDAYFGVD
jgi:hypothetical protein